MRKFFGSFTRFGGFFIFIFLEIICFILIIRFNESQRTIFIHSTNLISGNLLEKYQSAVSYLHLTEVADSLAASNARLLEQIVNKQQENFIARDTQFMAADSNIYKVIAARVINNSIGRNHNYLTLDKGSSHKLRPNMGVISDRGVVGIIKNVSTDYALVMSLLHRQMRLSAAVKRNGYFGTLVWRTPRPRFMTLEDVPKHADIQLGDTIVTSGYSAIFPPAIPVGVVEQFEIVAGGGTYRIEVRLTEDLSKVERVYAIAHLKKAQIEKLTEEVIHE